MTVRTRSALYKPGYDGLQPRIQPVADQREFAIRRAELVERLGNAMLTLSVVERSPAPIAGVKAGWPEVLRTFGDLIGAEAEEAPPKRFKPTAAMVDDMLPALALLEGLRREYFKVIYLKAWGDFLGKATWEAIGDRFMRSPAWAKDAYERAIIQAARRAGLMAMPADDYAVVSAAVIAEGRFLTWIGFAKDPKQAIWELKTKSPLALTDAFAIWVPGRPVAQRLVDAARALHGRHKERGAWFQCSPLDVEDTLLIEAGKINSPWRVEYLGAILEKA